LLLGVADVAGRDIDRGALGQWKIVELADAARGTARRDDERTTATIADTDRIGNAAVAAP
jgi:hypothetical protein